MNANSEDPRRSLEKAFEQLADLLREAPTLPCSHSAPSEPCSAAMESNVAIRLPKKHCAFKNCTFQCEKDIVLINHLQNQHAEVFTEIFKLLPELSAPRKEMEFPHMLYGSIYNEAIAIKIRRGAPLASLAIDRRALRNYTEALSNENVDSLICWCCARKFPYVARRKANVIVWTQPLQLDATIAS